MLKETVTYTNFDGVEVKSDIYFNISKMEFLEMGVDRTKERLQRMVNESDGKKILDEVREITHKAYGEKSEDGRHFIKNDEILNKFKSSPAYDEFLFSLVSSPVKASEFVKALFPEEMIKAMADAINKGRDESEKVAI